MPFCVRLSSMLALVFAVHLEGIAKPIATTPCTGSSALLSDSECAAWQTFHDGLVWPSTSTSSVNSALDCRSNRATPCDCGNATCWMEVSPCVECRDRSPSANATTVAQGTSSRYIGKINLAATLAGGTIAPAIAAIPDLQFLVLSSNALSGSIPESLAQLGKLNVLWASGNALGGVLPRNLPWNQYKTSCDCDLNGNNFSCPVVVDAKIHCDVYRCEGGGREY